MCTVLESLCKMKNDQKLTFRWEMFSEEEPFLDFNNIQIITSVLQNSRPNVPIANIPHQLNSLISICWDQEPSKRPDMVQVKDLMKPIEIELLHEEVSNQKIGGKG